MSYDFLGDIDRIGTDAYKQGEKLKRTVAAALRPYESDEVDIPSDCPLE